MRAFVITGPESAEVQEVPRPRPGPGQVVIDIARVGVCGTDTEFFRGTQPYLATGSARYPLRIGHEWCGTVSEVGSGVAPDWLGKRVTGDTMLGCQSCRICQTGCQHLCPQRSEVGVLNGWHGALADALLMPVTAIHEIPAEMGDGLGALVEPASLSLRCVDRLDLHDGDPVLVWGLGAVGLLAVAFATAAGLEVHAVGRSETSLDLARQFGASKVFQTDRAGGPPQFDSADYCGAIAASPVAETPQLCLERLQPGGVLVAVGIAGRPSPLEVRDLVVNDIQVNGLLSGSAVFARTIEMLAKARFDIEPVIGQVIELDQLAAVLAGRADPPLPRIGPGPKVQIRLDGAVAG